MAHPYVDIPGYDPRTVEQKMAAHDAAIRHDTVEAIVKDLEAWLPEHKEVSAGLYVRLLARVRRHTDKPTP